ncbi:Cyanovirin-N [Tricharina praecox]|uniref:Cyanovirin-N n=1 Tax=Tricharina praecox TaxID=43433 RepID=UPI002220DA2B|nr:Cyanovirin-N [Tricharina praecox]KAI5854963.1 Cyanovirin-N [Tricharina praecox]
MSFHLSSEEICVEDNRILVGRLRKEDGSLNETQIDLDQFIGNNNGHFQWDGEGFSGSASNVHFSIEGGGEVPVLRANLRDENGEEKSADINLAERVQNHNGEFVFV